MISDKTFGLLALLPAVISWNSAGSAPVGKPNILLVISDDQSWPYASSYGSRTVSTPGFDLVAKKGCLFTNAYVSSPGCSPSRASILTGLFPWQTGEAGTHASSFPARYICYPDILKQNGYFIGFTGKGWAPGNWKVSGRPYNPAGPEYNDIKLTPPYTGISPIDYSANFIKFLSDCPSGRSFCFWLGAHEPHRSFEEGSWKKEGYNLDKAEIPPFLPKSEIIQGDILNYAVEIEWFDKHLMKCIRELERKNELDNTIIIVTSDNGMAFPDAKANCYDAGIHVPLAICWGKNIKGSKVIGDLVSLVDLAPTIIEAAGIKVKNTFSGSSLLPIIQGKRDKNHSEAVFAGRERHSFSRYNNLGYPVRAIRWKNYLLVHNFRPGRWPAGDPSESDEKGYPVPGFAYHDIDDSPSKVYLIANRTNRDISPFFESAVDKRPEYQLFDVVKDPGCLINIISDITSRKVLKKMMRLLDNKLVNTKDPRIGSNPEIWETYPRLEGKMRNFPAPSSGE